MSFQCLICILQFNQQDFRSECDATIRNWSNSGNASNCRDNSWLYDSSTVQWTLSRGSITGMSTDIMIVHTNGLIATEQVFDNCGARPVLYLKSDVKITGGSGTKEQPFELSI